MLDPGQYLEHDAVGQLLHEGFVVEVEELVDPGLGNVDDLVLVQPVDDGNDPQDPQEAQAAHRDAAHQVVPVDKRVEVPAIVDAGFDGVAPAQHELGEEDADEDQVVEDEIFMDGVVDIPQGAGMLGQQVLDRGKTVNRIENDEGHVDHQQAQHHEVDGEPDQLMAFSQVFAVDVEHWVTQLPVRGYVSP